MNWAETIVKALKDWNTSMIVYVPDISIHQVTSLIEADPFFHLVSATREEEAIGIAAGAYAVGRNSAVFMQSSGFGNCVNALASLCIPCRTPIPLFINLRGGVGEFNIAQVAMGRTTRPILDLLGLVHFTLEDEHKMDLLMDGALKLCHAGRQPVAICMTQLLHGGKIA
ncbi:MAG: thiamine pyrophosphate-binding protein [Dehalococcoidia bacterium]|jgi:sulfopyruvate decarboxylase alpha subunit|nr:thiamine pyrophosphate-binding protein [Dehalococcoidia bacterium]MDP6226372.1 thiamine pyrophosphate-binding protein [Dehalococcoidia bacterium]MDP7084595.1 thiamine pyrophosphate-binding protein [Dehalococcoidia bacterium]MDP7201451.1 thiamine pyrophosphate-binding protein [Dehalococcoidia bacterium]MDP7509385.1 thiamine pyrophosphate-binding protein [Dehalococcoidia bacterium]|tara:strand:+ start:95 stop:601 length:507 start_codon:yes stop_codon:yes gene_type:complete